MTAPPHPTVTPKETQMLQMSPCGDTSYGSSSGDLGLQDGLSRPNKAFPTHGLAEGFKHTIQLASIVVAELLHVVYALPTKWSWGLSHASPPGMVPTRLFSSPDEVAGSSLATWLQLTQTHTGPQLAHGQARAMVRCLLSNR